MSVFGRENVPATGGGSGGSISNCSIDVTGEATVGGTNTITATFDAVTPDNSDWLWTVALSVGGETITTTDLTVPSDGRQFSVNGSYTFTQEDAGRSLPVEINVTSASSLGSDGTGDMTTEPLRFVSGYVGTLAITTAQETDFYATIENTGNEPVFAGVAFYVDGNQQGSSQTNVPSGRYQFHVGALGQNLPTGSSMPVEAELISGTGDFENWERGERKSIGTLTVEEAPSGSTGDDGTEGDADIGSGPGTCPDGYQWSESIQDCIPTCPEGQFYVPGSGCIGVSSPRRLHEKTRIRR